MDNRQRPEKPAQKLKLRLVNQRSEEEALEDVRITGNLARRRDMQAVEIEIDLSDDEVRQGVQVTEVEPKRGIVKEVATAVVAILLIIFIFLLKTNVPQTIGLSILGAIVLFYFGARISRNL